MIATCSRRLAVLFVLVLGLVQVPQSIEATPDPLAPVRARFAPDRRIAVFNVTTEVHGDTTVVRGEVESAAAHSAVLEAIAATGAHVVDQVNLLPDAKLGSETHGVVRVSVANVRSKPAHAAEMVTQTLLGWPVRMLKEQDGWFLVHTEPDGYLGWIEELQLAPMTPAERRAWDTSSLGIVTVPWSVVRESADPAAPIVTDLVVGALLQSVSTVNGWTRVVLPDDRTGWVPDDAVQSYAEWQRAVRPTADGIGRTAKLFMGVPYLWGGTSSKGFDCSGLAKTVMHLNGIELPRDTDQQAQVGTAVPIDEKLTALRPGDLLFFGSRATEGRLERVSHVGIHIGDLEFIHASGLVRRNSLDPASRIYGDTLRKRLLHVRRVLPGSNATTNIDQ